VTLSTPKMIDDAMTALADPDTPVEDRAAVYGLLYEIQRRIHRALGTYLRHQSTPKTELTEHLIRNGEELGPLYVVWESFDVAWPVNDPANWDDAGVQEQLEMFRLVSPDYIRHVPDHLEIDTAALGAGLVDNDPVARQLHTECKDRGWRTEGGRRAALKVREVKP